MVALYADKLDEQHEQLAYHYERGGKIDEAVEHLGKAGERAIGSYALKEAEDLFSQALGIKGEEEDGLTASLLFGRGRARFLRWGDSAEASADVWRAFQLYCQSGNVDLALEIAGSLLPFSGRDREMLRRALELAQPDSIEEARIAANLCSETTPSGLDFDAALEVARRESDVQLQVRILCLSAQAIQYEDRFGDALTTLQQAIDLSTKLGDLQEVSHIHISMGKTYKTLGDSIQSDNHFEEGLRIAEKAGLMRIVADHHSQAAWDAVRYGNLSRAITLINSSIDALENPNSLAVSAWFYFFAGQYDTALERARRTASILAEEELYRNDTSQYPIYFLAWLAFIWRVPELVESAAIIVERLPAPTANDNSVVYWGAFAELYVAILRCDREAIHAGMKALGAAEPTSSSLKPDWYEVLGHGAFTLGDLPDAVDRFEASTAGWADRSPTVFRTAFAYFFTAEALLKRGGAGDAARAGEYIQAGKTIAEDTGLLPLIERFENLEAMSKE